MSDSNPATSPARGPDESETANSRSTSVAAQAVDTTTETSSFSAPQLTEMSVKDYTGAASDLWTRVFVCHVKMSADGFNDTLAPHQKGVPSGMAGDEELGIEIKHRENRGAPPTIEYWVCHIPAEEDTDKGKWTPLWRVQFLDKGDLVVLSTPEREKDVATHAIAFGVRKSVAEDAELSGQAHILSTKAREGHPDEPVVHYGVGWDSATNDARSAISPGDHASMVGLFGKAATDVMRTMPGSAATLLAHGLRTRARHPLSYVVGGDGQDPYTAVAYDTTLARKTQTLLHGERRDIKNRVIVTDNKIQGDLWLPNVLFHATPAKATQGARGTHVISPLLGVGYSVEPEDEAGICVGIANGCLPYIEIPWHTSKGAFITQRSFRTTPVAFHVVAPMRVVDAPIDSSAVAGTAAHNVLCVEETPQELLRRCSTLTLHEGGSAPETVDGWEAWQQSEDRLRTTISDLSIPMLDSLAQEAEDLPLALHKSLKMNWIENVSYTTRDFLLQRLESLETDQCYACLRLQTALTRLYEAREDSVYATSLCTFVKDWLGIKSVSQPAEGAALVSQCKRALAVWLRVQANQDLVDRRGEVTRFTHAPTWTKSKVQEWVSAFARSTDAIEKMRLFHGVLLGIAAIDKVANVDHTSTPRTPAFPILASLSDEQILELRASVTTSQGQEFQRPLLSIEADDDVEVEQSEAADVLMDDATAEPAVEQNAAVLEPPANDRDKRPSQPHEPNERGTGRKRKKKNQGHTDLKSAWSSLVTLAAYRDQSALSLPEIIRGKLPTEEAFVEMRDDLVRKRFGNSVHELRKEFLPKGTFAVLPERPGDVASDIIAQIGLEAANPTPVMPFFQFLDAVHLGNTGLPRRIDSVNFTHEGSVERALAGWQVAKGQTKNADKLKVLNTHHAMISAVGVLVGVIEPHVAILRELLWSIWEYVYGPKTHEAFFPLGSAADHPYGVCASNASQPPKEPFEDVTMSDTRKQELRAMFHASNIFSGLHKLEATVTTVTEGDQTHTIESYARVCASTTALQRAVHRGIDLLENKNVIGKEFAVLVKWVLDEQYRQGVSVEGRLVSTPRMRNVPPKYVEDLQKSVAFKKTFAAMGSLDTNVRPWQHIYTRPSQPQSSSGRKINYYFCDWTDEVQTLLWGVKDVLVQIVTPSMLLNYATYGGILAAGGSRAVGIASDLVGNGEDENWRPRSVERYTYSDDASDRYPSTLGPEEIAKWKAEEIKDIASWNRARFAFWVRMQTLYPIMENGCAHHLLVEEVQKLIRHPFLAPSKLTRWTWFGDCRYRPETLTPLWFPGPAISNMACFVKGLALVLPRKYMEEQYKLVLSYCVEPVEGVDDEQMQEPAVATTTTGAASQAAPTQPTQ